MFSGTTFQYLSSLKTLSSIDNRSIETYVGSLSLKDLESLQSNNKINIDNMIKIKNFINNYNTITEPIQERDYDNIYEELNEFGIIDLLYIEANTKDLDKIYILVNNKLDPISFLQYFINNYELFIHIPVETLKKYIISSGFLRCLLIKLYDIIVKNGYHIWLNLIKDLLSYYDIIQIESDLFLDRRCNNEKPICTHNLYSMDLNLTSSLNLIPINGVLVIKTPGTILYHLMPDDKHYQNYKDIPIDDAFFNVLNKK